MKSPTVEKFGYYCKKAIQTSKQRGQKAALVFDKKIENLKHNITLSNQFKGLCKALYEAYQTEVARR